MKRRIAVFALVAASCSARNPAPPPQPAGAWCTPDQPCWPSEAAWSGLASTLTGTLEVPASPLTACATYQATEACATAIAELSNPFHVQDLAAGTLTTGWLDAWTAAPSAYAVAAENAADIVAAVKFAREHRLRLVIKGTGHDYLGRSTDPDALLVWTHRMRDVTVRDAFVPAGCTGAGTPAVTVGAGTRWLEAYQAVTVEHGRYVQGGGCTSVGAAGGFLQGGGFGSWSKKYGTAAASMLEAEVVVADGRRLIANACQNEDLFWALRGGGGGTFGIVTRVTLRTHELPSHFGLLFGEITATSDDAFRELIERFLRFYGEHLDNESWGEQVSIEDDNALHLSLAFQGMTAADAEAIWRPFRAWIDEHPDRFAMQTAAFDMPGTKMWDVAYLKESFAAGITPDPRPGSSLYWWANDGSQVSAYIYAYQSRWIPADLFEGTAATSFASTLFDASRHWSVSLHFNKGQAGAAADALARDRETSMNPAVYQAAALAIMSADGRGFPGLAGHEPDAAEAAAVRARVDAAAAIVRAATPGAGTYANEADYFEPDWQESFWGDHYAKLLAIKRVYDPDSFFRCHHCVGSE